MNTKEEMSEWEREHMHQIIGWKAEWDVKPGFKVITFEYKDIEGKKDQKIFEFKIEEQNQQ